MKGIQVCLNEGPCAFPRGYDNEIVKVHWPNLTTWSISNKQSILEWRGFKFLQIKKYSILKQEIIWFLYLNQRLIRYNHSFVQMCLLIESVSQMSDVVHGPFVNYVNLAALYEYIYPKKTWERRQSKLFVEKIWGKLWGGAGRYENLKKLFERYKTADSQFLSYMLGLVCQFDTRVALDEGGHWTQQCSTETSWAETTTADSYETWLKWAGHFQIFLMTIMKRMDPSKCVLVTA